MANKSNSQYRKFNLGFLAFALAVTAVPASWAKNAVRSRPAPRRPASSSASKDAPPKAPDTSGRGKNLTFEDEMVEGMNRNPFDSVTSIRTKEMKGTSKLYRVKGQFGSEIKLTVEEAGFTQ